MRTLPFITIAACSAMVMTVGCTSADNRTTPAKAPVAYRRPWSDEDVVKPAWIADPTRSGSIVAAWGSAPHDPQGGRGAMRDAALISARRELANMIRVRIHSVLSHYLAESGGSGGSTVTSYADTTSRAIANESIEGSAQRDEWIHPKTGELFVWAVVTPQFTRELAKSIADRSLASPQADAHVRATFAADRGFDELDRLIDKAFSTSTGR